MNRPAALARSFLARRLESDVSPWGPLRALSSVWGSLSGPRLLRPLAIPDGSRVIGVGGATLGGSCKTPFAIALARELASRGERVALVGHAYRARPRRARVVLPGDDVRDVGDEALWAARSLAPSGVQVIVAPSRQAALDLAARLATHLVVDGLLQSRPLRLARSILLLDAERPLGSGRCPPAGDLRAPRHALLGAADVVLMVRDVETGGAPNGEILSRVSLPPGAPSDLGLLLAIARPERVIRSLACRGLRPSATVLLGDHDAPSLPDLERATAKTQRVDCWLTTAKCATKLPPSLRGAPIIVLRHEILLPPSLLDWASSDSSLPSSPAHEPW